jgi:hypothetical protein
MSEGLRNMIVSVVVVLAAPVAVTAMAAAGVSPGDALEAIGVDRDPDESVDAPGPATAPPASSGDGDARAPRAAQPGRFAGDDSATSAGGLTPSGRRPTAPEPGTPTEPPEPTATTPVPPGPAAEPDAPAEPGAETPSGPLDDVDDVLDDPVGAADDVLEDGLNGLAP